MSGRAGIRGYLFQTLIALLDALHNDNEWTHLKIEPELEDDKVDILWCYPEERCKAVQVKSSKNRIDLPKIKKWAEQLQDSRINVSDLELMIVGYTSGSVIQMKKVGSVKVPPPKQPDPYELMQQAAHRLDLYLETRGFSPTPPRIREILIPALLGRLFDYSSEGQEVLRTDFDFLLREWILTIYPTSFNETLDMQCDALTNTIMFGRNADGSEPVLVVPFEFVNQGKVTAIVEKLLVKMLHGEWAILWTAVMEVSSSEIIQGKARLGSSFPEFGVMPQTFRKMDIAFIQVTNHPGYPVREITEGNYRFEIYIKYRDKGIPLLQRTLDIPLSSSMLVDWNTVQGGLHVLSPQNLLEWEI